MKISCPSQKLLAGRRNAKKEKTMKQEKTKGISLLLTLILMGFVPLFVATATLTLLAYVNVRDAMTTDVYDKLQIAATNVEEYFVYDVIANGDVDYEEYADHTFMESIQAQGVELTLFKGDTRLLTSIRDDAGQYYEGTQASAEVYEKVSAGSDFSDDSVVINGEPYYVYYKPINDGEGRFWGMAFAGTPQANINKTLSKITAIFIAAAMGVAIVFTTIIVILALRIKKSIVTVKGTLNNLASGKLSNNLDIRDAIVEISEIINSTNELDNKLSAVIGTVKNNTATLVSSIDTVHTSAGESANGTEQIAIAMDELSNTTMSLSENVQNVNSQAQDMGDAIQGINENVSALSTASAEIKEATENAQNDMNKVMESSGQSAAAVTEISESISLTNESIEKITNAVNLISDIASQTNLLSLNASIEAARAGEAGHGFAVVAEEIGKLSQESAASADTIMALAKDMETKSADTVKLAGKIGGIINEEQNCVKDTQSAFDSLEASIEKILAMISEIDQKTADLVTLKEGIVENISNLSAIAEETAASNQEVTASITGIAQLVQNVSGQSDTMSDLSTDLSTAVSYFN